MLAGSSKPCCSGSPNVPAGRISKFEFTFRALVLMNLQLVSQSAPAYSSGETKETSVLRYLRVTRPKGGTGLRRKTGTAARPRLLVGSERLRAGLLNVIGASAAVWRVSQRSRRRRPYGRVVLLLVVH